MGLHNILGKEGERAVFAYLEQKGYRILEKNWHYQNFEVDLIVSNYELIAFVEVKTRTSNFIVSPLESVDRKKQNNLIRAANIYVQIKQISLPIRFDIVSAVYFPAQGIFEIEHYADAFIPRPKRY